MKHSSPPGYPDPKFLCMFSAVSSSTHSLKVLSLVTCNWNKMGKLILQQYLQSHYMRMTLHKLPLQQYLLHWPLDKGYRLFLQQQIWWQEIFRRVFSCTYQHLQLYPDKPKTFTSFRTQHCCHTTYSSKIMYAKGKMITSVRRTPLFSTLLIRPIADWCDISLRFILFLG